MSIHRRALVLLAVAVLASCDGMPDGAPRNLILLVADGCGPASFTLARDFARERLGRELAVDGVLTGAVMTRSARERVTDSAASATAYACGIRTWNGYIATDTSGRPVRTLLEEAERADLWTGLVTTARLTHATPAAFSSHVTDRDQEEEIAAQQIGQGIEVLFGGGVEFFRPASDGGRRGDGRDLVSEAASAGYGVAGDRASLSGLKSVPALALVSEDHAAYEIDRPRSSEPGLVDMTRKALELLSGAPVGFFLMVEAGRIDHAAHDNDPAAHLGEILAFDDALRAVLEFARLHGSTLVVATSDHETGGLSVGRDGIYDWRPEALDPVDRSLESLTGDIEAALARAGSEADALSALIETATAGGFGPFSDTESDALERAVSDGWAGERRVIRVASRAAAVLGRIVSRRAGTGWTSEGHTAVDVPLHAWGPGSARFAGRLTNDEVGRRLARVMGLGGASEGG